MSGTESLDLSSDECDSSVVSDGEEGVMDRHSEPPRGEVELNGTYERPGAGKSPHDSDPRAGGRQGDASETSGIRENGVAEVDPPHGSVIGSNGFILSGQQKEGGASHRTSGSPTGTSRVGHATKTLPPSSGLARARNLAASKTDTGSGGETETKNGMAKPPVTVHRARKTMARPASNQSTLKVLETSILSTQIVLTMCIALRTVMLTHLLPAQLC